MKAKEKEGVLGRKFYEDELYELDRFELFVDEEDEDDENNNNENDDQNGNESDNEGGNENNERNNRHILPRSGENTYKGYRPVHVDGNNEGFGSIYETYRRTKETFLNITDHVIAKGLAIPRSASVFTGTPDSAHNDEVFRMDNLNHRRADPVDTSLENQDCRNTDRNNTIRFASNNDIHRTSNSSNWRHSNNLNNSTAQNRRDVFVYSTREVIIDASDNEA